METRKLFILRERKGMAIERTRDGKEILEKEEKYIYIYIYTSINR
jgi:hypothetical protein